MIDLLEALFGPFIPSLEGLMPYVPYVIGALIALALIVRFGVPFLLALTRRLVTRTPRSLFKAKATLLAHRDICEMYAPANQYMTDREDGKKGGAQFAWLSPFERAVRNSIKRNPVSKARKFNARAQVREAARAITVRAPHAADYVVGDLKKHYRIDMKLDGHDAKEIENMQGRVKSQLGLHSVERIETSDNYTLSMIAHKEEPEDILLTRKSGVELFDEHPAKSPSSLPMALLENGLVWALAMGHTLIYGATGSGKGAVIHAIVRQLLQFFDQGKVKFYGIDPKMTELKVYANTSLFEEVVQDTEDAQEVIAHVYKMMQDRAKNAEIDIEGADLKRRLKASKEYPMVNLIIDEGLDLLLSLKAMGKSGTATIGLLTGILSKGRSLGFNVIMATQEADKELFGRMRSNFLNKITLRSESDWINDLFLGDGAAKRGFDSSAIPTSNEDNGYKWAGIGYAKGESGDPLKMRFAYSSDDDLIEIIKRYPKDEFDAFGELPSTRNESDTLEDEPKASTALPDLEDDFAGLPALSDD